MGCGCGKKKTNGKSVAANARQANKTTSAAAAASRKNAIDNAGGTKG